MTPGYTALREWAALIELPGRGHIRMVGQDRARLLHAMSTNHIEQLAPGQGCYAFFLNAQGRILADAHVFRLDECHLLDTEPECRAGLYAHLDHYIIADDVELEDRTDDWLALGVEGPAAAGVLASAGIASPPEQPFSIHPAGEDLVARVSASGGDGFRLFVPVGERRRRMAKLENAGAVAATPEELRAARIENGRPRYAEDITSANLPQETQLMHALHFSKGCYLGQEIVERVRSRGHVNRLLVGLTISGVTAPPSEAPVLAAGQPAGAITSAAFSPASGRVLALAYLRAEVVAARPPLAVNGAAAEIHLLKPS